MKAIVIGFVSWWCALFLVACGGAAESTSTSTTTTSAPVLQSISITNTAPIAVEVGSTLQLVASGTYSDASTKTLTSEVTWAVAGKNATISGGLLKGVLVGADSVTATLGSIVGTVGITVSPILKSLAVSPMKPTIEVGTSVQMTATGTYSDGSVAAVSKDLTWTAIGTPVQVSVSASGLVTGLVVGAANSVQAKVGTITGATTVTVNYPYVTMATGGSHSLVSKKDGSLLAWGLNRSGQLGDGTLTNRTSPVLVSSLATNWAQLSAGDFHTLATRTDGSLWAWGFNQNGQLGDKSTVDKSIPTQVGTDKTWTAISAGKAHGLAVKKDGTLWAWGRNFDSQLGDASNADRTAPVQILVTAPVGTTAPTAIAADKKWATVAAGGNFSVGRQLDGSVYTWGGNVSGQLGRGTTTAVAIASNVPIPVVTTEFSKASAIAAGNAHVLAIRTDNVLFAWGDNSSGQLGSAEPTVSKESLAPIKIPDGEWVAVAAGAAHSLGITTDGRLWAWGDNTFGQLGIKTQATSAQTPTLVDEDIKNWVRVFAGKNHSFAIKTDGSVWGWGSNAEGQLGNGSTSPAKVMLPTPLN
ncbi:MAG: Ig-like domain-containing protein [Rhodoferax sp.]|nr:Ig-like domain-containing protein [Rhodoferax sp.]